jgi:teichuronic acid biosynthesis glycosyltransferase TuaH
MYDCSDNWTNKDDKSFLNKILDFLTSKSEKLIVKNTRIHSASSPFLKDKIELLSLKECHLIEHGYNPSLFKNEVNKTNEVEKLCFIGALQGNKVDIELLYSMAKLRLNWEFWIIGPVPMENLKDSTYRLFEKLENVYIKGAVAPELIPQELETMDIGLLPYKNTEFTKGVFPLKFYEYLASNLNVVGCNLDSLKRFVDLGVYIESTDNVEDFIDKCEIALKTDVPIKVYEKLLKGATWEKRFDKLFSKVIGE